MTKTKRRTALIDLGSNSARLLIVEWNAGAGPTILRQEKIMTRLGEGVFVHRRLAPQPDLGFRPGLSAGWPARP